MKMTIERTSLLKPLQMISSVAERSQTMPILGHVLISVQGSRLSLTGTDTEIELIGTLPLDGEVEDGLVTVSARKLLDICRALSEDALMQFTLEKDHLILMSGKSRFVLTTLPAQDFPDISEKVSFNVQFTINAAKLKSLFTKTYFAMAQQDVRHYLNAALIEVAQGTMRCVTTDGHRLAFSSVADDCFSQIEIRTLLPRKSVLELMRLLESNDDNSSDVNMAIGENHYRVTFPGFVFTSRLLNAQYPDYQKLVPRKVENTAIFNREALKQAIARAAILSNEKFRVVRLQLERDLLRILANNPAQEEAEELVQLDYQGGGMETGFNANYLLDAISTVVSEHVHWSFADPDRGILIESPEENGSFCVVMPMRL
jgi:DNA polymerase-3 subunit beta